jgi:hypothetical protein
VVSCRFLLSVSKGLVLFKPSKEKARKSIASSQSIIGVADIGEPVYARGRYSIQPVQLSSGPGFPGSRLE